jgi:hypothetical protein
MKNKQKLIFWELNEINFDYINFYISEGKLPNWKKFIDKYGLNTTNFDESYNNTEPWIQWPSIRTGLTYKEHKVFRLGDIEDSNLRQHWEILEEKGYSVAAISPINAKNNTEKSSFWIPDPWVNTKVSGNQFIKRFSNAINQTVNDNSGSKITISSFFTILQGLLTKSRLSSFPRYFSCIIGALKKQHWSKAIIFDRLLADVFFSLWEKHQPDFSVIFMNSGAHIQHHYLFNSKAYIGSNLNPDWYIQKNQDPLLDILEMYDDVLHEIQSLNNVRLIVAVGLRQIPYEKPAFYWRLKDHKVFLKKIGIKFKKVHPRMTRDFLIEFDNEEELVSAQLMLSKIKSINGDVIFGIVDNRGKDLFVSLTYSNDVSDSFKIFLDAKEFKSFKNDLNFVAIKNGHHDSLGYYLDTSRNNQVLDQNIPIENIFHIVMNHFDS